MKKKIAIIGAGIAGLTLANLIKKKSDHEFMLYEKLDSLSLDEGYGIQLSTNSIKILNSIGFDKINIEKIFNPKGIDFYDINHVNRSNNKRVNNLQKEKYSEISPSIGVLYWLNTNYGIFWKFRAIH